MQTRLKLEFVKQRDIRRIHNRQHQPRTDPTKGNDQFASCGIRRNQGEERLVDLREIGDGDPIMLTQELQEHRFRYDSHTDEDTADSSSRCLLTSKGFLKLIVSYQARVEQQLPEALTAKHSIHHGLPSTLPFNCTMPRYK